VTDLLARVKPILDEAIGSLCTAAVVRVERRGSVDTYAAGTLCPDPSAGPEGPCTTTSLFDLASLTKLATTALVLSFVRERQLELGTPLRELVPDFRGGNKDRVTLKQVLTHTGGLAWWKSFWKEASTPEELVWLAAKEPLAQDIGEFRYSDLGYIMLTAGLANLERLAVNSAADLAVAQPIALQLAKLLLGKRFKSAPVQGFLERHHLRKLPQKPRINARHLVNLLYRVALLKCKQGVVQPFWVRCDQALWNEMRFERLGGRSTRLQTAHRLAKRLFEGAPNCHHFAPRLHLPPKHTLGARKLFELPAR